MTISFHGRLKIVGDFNSSSFMLAIPLVNGNQLTSSLIPLKIGDRVQAFNTIASGTELGRFTINLVNKSGLGVVQEEVALNVWTSYFREQAAVSVERGSEPPMQGALVHPGDYMDRTSPWVFAPFDGSGDVVFQNDDKVTMYRFVTQGAVATDMVLQSGDKEQMDKLKAAQESGYPVKLTRNFIL